MPEQFEYPALDAEKRQIRLLTVEKTVSEELACDLTVVSLNDDFEYSALSYVWGIEEPTCPVHVSDQLFLIRPNLYAYLQLAAKEQTRGRGIFVDAICVNQNDIAEKSSQVALMSLVYRGASEVTVWFGIEEH